MEQVVADMMLAGENVVADLWPSAITESDLVVDLLNYRFFKFN